MKDDDDQELRLVSYADSSGESSAEEATYTQMMVKTLVKERDNKRPGTRGNGSRSGSQSSNGGCQKSRVLGEKRDKASRGETRQDFSESASSKSEVAVSKGTMDGSEEGGSLVVGSTDEVLPGQRVAGQENGSESAGVLPGQNDAGQGTVSQGAGQVTGGERLVEVEAMVFKLTL